MKDLKHIKRFNESEENLNISDVSDSDLFQEDSESLMIEVVDKIKPFYQKYGLENTIFFLESILDGIHDVGSEYFGE
jgi:uncharacterized sporulation protein YeaH/YhbH (DUF444 family)